MKVKYACFWKSVNVTYVVLGVVGNEPIQSFRYEDVLQNPYSLCSTFGEIKKKKKMKEKYGFYIVNGLCIVDN